MGKTARWMRTVTAPDSWRRALGDVAADLRMVVRTFAGDGPSPVLRSTRRPPQASSLPPTAPWEPARMPAAIPTTAGAQVRVVAGGVDAALVGARAGATMTVRVGAERHEVRVDRGQSLLAAAEAAGIVMPSSCRAGGCGACRVRLIAGAVALPATHCLSAAELEAGEILTCVTSPDADVVIEVQV